MTVSSAQERPDLTVGDQSEDCDDGDGDDQQGDEESNIIGLASPSEDARSQAAIIEEDAETEKRRHCGDSGEDESADHNQNCSEGSHIPAIVQWLCDGQEPVECHCRQQVHLVQ